MKQTLPRPNALPAEKECEIYRRYHSGETQTSLALQYNITQQSVSNILKKCNVFANTESIQSNRPSATASSSSIPAYVVHDPGQTQNLYSTHMFQSAVQSRMLYAQVGSEFSARPIGPVWSQPVQISSNGGCGRPSNLHMGYASALFAAAASSKPEASNASGTDCTSEISARPIAPV